MILTVDGSLKKVKTWSIDGIPYTPDTTKSFKYINYIFNIS